MLLNEISDDLLIHLWRSKNQDAFDLLHSRYRVFIYGIINDFAKNSFEYLDFDDLYQEAFLIFLRCIDSYDEEAGCFYFFVRRAIERTIVNYMKKNKKSRKTSSLDEMFYDSDKETLVDYICEDSFSYDYSLYEQLTQKIGKVNKQIVDYKMEGYSYLEISRIMHISKGGIYSRVNKIKNILKDIIEKID